MKYLKLLLLSILQYLLVVALLYIYNEKIGIKGARLQIGISFYYYQIVFSPIIIIIWNAIYATIKNTKMKYFLLCIPLFIIALYWIGSMGTYPYRVSFTILISIGILVIGSFVIKRYILKK